MIEVPFSDPSVNAIIQAAFPGVFSRRTVKVEVRETYRVSDYWSGGSRDEAIFVELSTLKSVSAQSLPPECRQQKNNPYNLAIGEVVISPGYAIVEHVIFQGKDLGYRIYLNRENMMPLLTARPSDLCERDRRILVSYRSLKSGPYRKEALDRLAFTDADLKRLVLAGLLKQSSNGATQITIKGRAACANEMVF